MENGSTSNERELYFKERISLNEGEFKIAESYDKALLTLSAGALAISMTFIKDVAEDPKSIWMLITAWFILGLTTVVLLLTFLICQKAYQKARTSLDDREIARLNNDAKGQIEATLTKNRWAHIVTIGNFLCLILFVTGIIFLGIFIRINM